jgi:WD40 repeat protein
MDVFFVLNKATHRVKFWRLESLPTPSTTTTNRYNERKRMSDEETATWLCFKSFFLQSRASALKFDANYLLASTYFLTMDLYSMSAERLLCQFMGHTCSITSFDFQSDPLQLICTGSADNSVKFWSMADIINPSAADQVVVAPATDDDPRIPLKSEPNLLWPVKVNIELLDRECNEYLVLVLCANGYLFLNLVSTGW